MPGKIAILIDAELHNEIVLRLRSPKDVSGIIENQVASFLDATEGDLDFWSEEYVAEWEELRADHTRATFGDPTKGYQWQIVFLPNGTRLRMTYKGRDNFAEVRHQRISADGGTMSPSEWASQVAGNTSRNAWRDIWLQFPGKNDWQLADVVRRAERQRING